MINVKSEILPLRKVMLHRPGNELLNLTPDLLNKLLFEDIPYLKLSRQEHDEYARIFKSNNVEVVYLEDLMAEVLDLGVEVKEKFIRQYVHEAGIKTPKYKSAVINFLMGFDNNRELVLKTIEGININELYFVERDAEHSLVDLTGEESKFLAEPMPNLVYLNDIFTSIINGVSINKLCSKSRVRESIYAEYIFNYHPEYVDVVKYYDKYNSYNIEGGDIFILNEHIMIVGVSERTMAESVEELSFNIFKDNNNMIDTILVFKIPNKRSYMHLDKVFTQIDYDKFLYYPGIMNTLSMYEITEDLINGIRIKELNDSLEDVLEYYLKRDIMLIPCGGGDFVISEREQWNNAVNVMSIRPGMVISYERNNITNAVLRRYGIKVIEIPSSELSRGRGGPRCMAIPLVRED